MGCMFKKQTKPAIVWNLTCSGVFSQASLGACMGWPTLSFSEAERPGLRWVSERFWGIGVCWHSPWAVTENPLCVNQRSMDFSWYIQQVR